MKLSQLTLHVLAFVGVLFILLTEFVGLVAAGQARRERSRRVSAAAFLFSIVMWSGCSGRQNPGDYKDTGTNAPSWSGPVMNRAGVATAFVDPPEIKFEMNPVGHHYRFQQAPDLAGPWQTVFERQNEYIEPVLRFSMYRTNVQMFYRVEVTL